LLDEPLSNLDANLRLRLRDDLRAIISGPASPRSNVTHDQAEAVVLGDRIGVMRDGRLLQIGAPAEIYKPAGRPLRRRLHRRHQPAVRPGRRSPGRVRHIEAASGHRLTAWLPAGVGLGAAVKIVVRPENVQCRHAR